MKSLKPNDGKWARWKHLSGAWAIGGLELKVSEVQQFIRPDAASRRMPTSTVYIRDLIQA